MPLAVHPSIEAHVVDPVVDPAPVEREPHDRNRTKIQIPRLHRPALLVHVREGHQMQRPIPGQANRGEPIVTTQIIVRTFNLWTGEGALFNELRAGRPGQASTLSAEKRQRLLARVREAEKDCDFCHPVTATPEDLFGRVEGKHCITASNIAKYDAYSGLVIFGQHNPLEFNREQLSDYIEVALRWYRRAHERENDFRYPFFGWNYRKLVTVQIS